MPLLHEASYPHDHQLQPRATSLLQSNPWTPPVPSPYHLAPSLSKASPFVEQQPLQSHEGRISFTRQIRQRRMPTEPADAPVSQRDQQPSSSSLRPAETPSSSSARANIDANPSRRTSSTVSSRSIRPPRSPSAESRTPLTPEESPPYRSTRKRTSSNLEDDDRPFPSVEPSPSHSRTNSSEHAAAVQVCICQPDPKIPRPRNAFILYRQHHQAKVIAEHPGLANPEISKIIGEQWRNQPADVKNEWKRLAEEEKVRHQQQYPTYRYQPRRNTRRNSLTETSGPATNEKARCAKCGGRTILAPSTYAGQSQAAGSSSTSLPPSTPTSSTTPSSRTLPILGDLSLQSPASRRMGRPFPAVEMSPRHGDERDDISPLSPDSKRRRYNNEQPMFMYRAVPPRYAIATGTPLNPGTPYPFPPAQHPHPYPPAQGTSHARRESLPSLRMMSPPGPMAPPPRPGPGYHQHRLSQGHVPPDRSLVLPPLQTGSSQAPASASSKGSESRSARDVIMAMPLAEKLEVLRRIAPPARLTKAATRGPLIAIEGDDVEAVNNLARWLVKTLGKEEEMIVKLIDPPDVAPKGDEESSMADYHLLAAEWLTKSKDIITELTYALPSPPTTGKSSMSIDSLGRSPLQRNDQKDDDQNDDARDNRMSIDAVQDSGKIEEEVSSEQRRASDALPPIVSGQALTDRARKPVLVIPAFSLHATNVFSCRIPITDVYSPKEHWQWSATLWRGIVGPDLTIYLRDADIEDNGRAVEQSETERLFIVRRNKVEGSSELEIESSTLRRVGFEVNEWVRAYGSRTKA